jgi:hypothetical protein
MTDDYGIYDHPVLDLAPEPTTDLFSEMTAIADRLRRHPRYGEADLPIAFRQLQQRRRPDLSAAQCLDLFALWREHYRARQDGDAVATSARVAELWQERDALLAERAVASADARSRIDARLKEVAGMMAASFEARGGRAVMRVR